MGSSGAGAVVGTLTGNYNNSTYWQYQAPDATDQWTQTAYDALGRPTVITGTDGLTTKLAYTIYPGKGPSSDQIDPSGHLKRWEYDAFGRLNKVYNGQGVYPNNTFNNDITTYQYNALDLLTRVVDAQNNSTIIHYDSLGRKTDMTDPDMGRWDYAYDANGNLIEQGEANYVAGQRMRVHFDYDALDRLTLKSYPNGNGTAASYFYDVSMGGTAVPNGKGQRTAMLSGNFTTRFNYDQRGRMNQAGYAIQDRTTYTMNWVYDAADRITSVTYPDYELVSYAYDPAWRPVNAYTNRGGTGGCYVCNAHYTALDQPQDLSLNGQNASNAKVRQNWTYDTNSQRLNQLTVTNLNTSAIYFNRSYGYDNVGNVNNIHSNLSGGENQTFGYDELDRLTGWSINGTQQEGYTYNKIGNLLTKGNTTYTYGDAQPHQVISTSGGANNSYTYDANGNMLTGAGRTITWNANNQPTHVTGNSQDEVMAYDADGERAERTRASGNYTTYYIGGLVEADWQSTNGGSTFQQITQRFLYTFNGQVVAQRTIDYNTGETLTYLHGDHLGSASLATDVNGNNAGQREFGPWGNIRTSNLTQTRIAYTGQLKDDSNLLYYHARMYDPSLGRFLSADSIVPGAADSNASADLVGQAEKMNLTVDFHETGFASALDQEINVTERRGFYFQLNKGDQQRAKNPDGPMNSQALNRYSYVLDNPLRYTDPSGHRYEHELA